MIFDVAFPRIVNDYEDLFMFVVDFTRYASCCCSIVLLLIDKGCLYVARVRSGGSVRDVTT